LLLLGACCSFVSPSCPWESPDLLPWSDAATWGDQGIPGDGDILELRQPVLLDTQTARLESLIILEGGALVFSPDTQLAKLTVGVVRIQENSSLLIGGPECRFPGQAEILLTGKQGPDTSIGHFIKGVYLEEGGTLDIHGEEKLSWTHLTSTLHPQSGTFEIQLEQNPVGWNVGDKLVIASTDYNMEQAEVVEVFACESCNHQLSCTCLVTGEIKFTHFGQIYKGLDMRAEVGLLSRNVLISGETDDEEDRFGGHIKAFRGFGDLRIRGAELTKMGQYGIVGRYPIHWHMAHSVEDKDTYARENSIHDVFQRCITVHGTHGVRVENNVAYNTFGHCYFLEDGGEKNTTLIRNLGLLTYPGITIPSDRRPATFWITSPLTNMIGNVAAGSAGVGIWYIFGMKVTGPSADQGFFQPGEAFKTPILQMSGNTAHSSNRGFFFGDELTEDQDFANKETNQCDPHEDPLNSHSAHSSNLVEDLTVYKNHERNVWNDCKYVNYFGLRSADSSLSFITTHGPVYLEHSLFIGESDNLGQPNEVRLRNGSKVMWHRSTPHGLNMWPVCGLEFYDGWVYADHNVFTDFYDDEYKVAGAITWKGIRGIKGFFKNSFFDYEDGREGNYVKGIPYGSYGSRNGERRGLIQDVDGTITGWSNTIIVPDRPFFTSSLCEPRSHWGNMSVCPHPYATLSDKGGYRGGNYIVARDDVDPALDVCTAGGPYPCHYRAMAMSADHSYIIAPTEYDNNAYLGASIEGIPEGQPLRLGICFPLNSSIYFDEWPGPVEMGSMDELMENNDGNGYFIDHEVGVVFRNFVGGKSKSYKIVVDKVGSDDIYCIDRAYPKYQTDPMRKI